VTPRPRARLLSLLVLALWLTPAASALAVGLHLALDHHPGDGRAGDQSAAIELAMAAVHGHRHDLEAVPNHEHPAPVAGGPSVHASAPAAADPPPTGRVPRLAGSGAGLLSPARRGPPTLLYQTHCSLLL